MNAKIVVTLAIALGLGGLTYQGKAQSPVVPSSLSGDSLSGINTRNAENDFTNFFFRDKSDSVNDMKAGENSNSNFSDQRARLRQIEKSLSQVSTPIILQPAESFNGNDGVQLQLDLAQ
ncbi:hypothetical protein [Calothrix rhizosoleniae]|uniref:hypothetical protein n=1 Tax=Calothrix rhizosoleniae TaxID=888997 RepID=UPI000B499734|nr:hypothetical protein [Calothrix rhizosoleniae]